MMLIIVVIQWAWDAEWYTINDDDDDGVLITCSYEMIDDAMIESISSHL